MLAQPRLLDSECGGGALRARDSHVITLWRLVERRLQARGGLISVQTEYDRIMVSYTTRHVYYAMSVCLSVAICCRFQRLLFIIPPNTREWCHAARATSGAAPLLGARGLGSVPRLRFRPARQPFHPASGGACTGGGRGRLRRLCRSRRRAVQDLGGRRRAPPQPSCAP
jgi:hypothetical protein